MATEEMKKSQESEKPESSLGYIVTCNTFAKRFHDTYEDITSYCDKIAKVSEEKERSEFSRYPQTYLAFGKFDRITYAAVKKFDRYYDVDDRSKYWLGQHQNLYLYALTDNQRVYPYEYDESKDFGVVLCDDEKYEIISVKGDNKKYYCVILTQISLNNEIVSRVENHHNFLKKLHEELRKTLESKINNYNIKGKVHFEIFGCMNTSEIAILWVSEQYTDVYRLINYMRTLKVKVPVKGQTTDQDKTSSQNQTVEPLFFGCYSIVSRMITNSYFKENKEIKIQGIALVHILLGNQKAGADADADNSYANIAKIFKEELEKKYNIQDFNITAIAGEFDLHFSIGSEQAYNMFSYSKSSNKNQSGLLEPGGDLAKYVIRSEVTLGVEGADNYIENNENIISELTNFLETDARYRQMNQLEKELDPNLEILNVRENKIGVSSVNGEKSLREMYLLIRRNLKKLFVSPISGAIDTLDILYTDYLSNIHNSYNALWRNDFHYQFKASLDYLLSLTVNYEKGEENLDAFWTKYNKTLNYLNQQIQHLAQSSRLTLQTPATHLRYTANCDMLFHAYYGIAKEILHEVYKIQKGSLIYQSELIPIITTTSTPYIKSELFHKDKECDSTRILQIDIPFSFLYNPIRGCPYIVHELFHYIAPFSRSKRNECTDRIVINEVIACHITEYVMHKLAKEYYHKIYNANRVDLKLLGYIGSAGNDHIREEYYVFLKQYHRATSNFAMQLKKNIVVKLYMMYQKDEDNTYKKLVKKILNCCNVYENNQKISFTDNEKKIEASLENISREEIGELLKLIDWKKLGELLKEELLVRDDGPLYRYLLDNIWKSLSLSFDNDYPKSIYDDAISRAKEDTLTGLREAIPDFAMLKLCGFDEIQYLSMVAMHYYSTGISPKKIPFNCIIRNISIIDYLEFCKSRGEKDFDTALNEYSKTKLEFQNNNREEFLRYLIADMAPNSYFDSNNNCSKFKLWIQRAEEYYERFDYAADQYFDLYKIYRRDFFQIYDEYSKYTTFTIGGENFSEIKQYRLEFAEQVLSIIKIYGLEINDIEKYKTINEEYRKLYQKYNKCYFEYSLKLSHYYQRQNTFAQINDEKKKNDKQIISRVKENKGSINHPDIINEKDEIDKYFILNRKYASNNTTSVVAFFRTLKDNCDQLRYIDGQSKGGDELWFRGQGEGSIGLLPSIMRGEIVKPLIQRSYEEYELFLNQNASVELYQMSKSIRNAWMKEEGYLSNLLEWHDSLISALKYALLSSKNNGEWISNLPSSLYIFSPKKYSQAVNFFKKQCSYSYEQGASDVIPNALMDFTDDTYKNYIQGAIGLNQTFNKKYKEFSSIDYSEYMPVTSIIPGKTQLRRFLAFSLLSPELENKKSYRHFDLELIQGLYFNQLLNKGYFRSSYNKTFLKKIEISGTLKKELADLLQAFQK